MTIWDLDLLHLDGNHPGGKSTSPYRIVDGFDAAPAQRKYQWSESEFGAGASLYGGSGQGNAERTIPLRVYARFTTALTNLLTNPRPLSVVTGWQDEGTGCTETLHDLEGEDVIRAVTTGSANSGVEHGFTATAVAHSAGAWVRVASGTAPIDVKFDGAAATSITATTTWQFVKTENITLTAATRYLQVIQTDTGSRTIYVKWACVHVGTSYAGFFDGASGDARWNGTAHASTSTCLTGQDAVNLAFGRLGEKGEKAVARSHVGGLECYWQPTGSAYRSRVEVRAVDVASIDYDQRHATNQIARCEVKITAHPYATGPEYSLATAYKAGGVPALEMLLPSGDGDVAGPLRFKLTNTSSSAFKYVVVGLQGRDYVVGTDLIIRAASFGVSGYSGALTAAINETQTLSRTGTPASGTFTLTLDGRTTSAIAYNATNATIQAALELLGNIGTGNVACTGGPIHTTNVTVTFQNDLGGCNVNLMTVTDSVGGGDITCAAGTAGVPGYVKADLFDAWTTIHDTGNMALIGSYRVIARVHDAAATSEIGDCQLQLVHGPGDMASAAQNDPVSPSAVGDSCLVDLGQIHIDPVATGTQRYKCKVFGRTDGTAGNDLRVLDLMFFPVETGAGEVKVIDSTESTLSMFENFGATSGALTADTSTSGHVWASMGGVTDAGDFTETAAPDNAVIRTDVSDTATDIRYGRGVILGTATPTDVRVSVDVSTSIAGDFDDWSGVIAHFTDNDNFVAAVRSALGVVRLYKVATATPTLVASVNLSEGTTTTQTLTLQIRSSGAWTVTLAGQVVASGTDAAFASGTLSAGKSGLIDWNPYAEAKTRTYSNFTVTIPSPEDAAAHPSQDLEFRDDTAIRESAAGDYYSIPGGATITNPPMAVPSGSEVLANRALILASRFNPDLAADVYADPFTVEALHTPVYLLARSE